MRHSGPRPGLRPARSRGFGAITLLAWALAVVATGLVAGRAVAVLDSGASRPSVMSPAEVDRALVVARAAAGPTSPPSPTAPAVTPPPSASPTAASPSSAPPTTAPPTTAPPPGGSPTATPDRTAAVARTWPVPGGTVAASCVGGTISLLYATPVDGWTVDVGSAGPDRIEVELKQQDQETKVVAVCSGGVPQRSVGDGSGDRSSDG